MDSFFTLPMKLLLFMMIIFCGQCSSEDTCPENWFKYENTSCFLPVHGSFKYPDADAQCTGRGGHLATINDLSMGNFVNYIYKTQGGGSYWIGLRKNGLNWVWPNGRLATYFNWRPGQPDGCCGPDVTCVLVDFQNEAGKWDDANCGTLSTLQQGYVCEKKLS